MLHLFRFCILIVRATRTRPFQIKYVSIFCFSSPRRLWHLSHSYRSNVQCKIKIMLELLAHPAAYYNFVVVDVFSPISCVMGAFGNKFLTIFAEMSAVH